MSGPVPTWINNGDHDVEVAGFVLEGDQAVRDVARAATDELRRVTGHRHVSFPSAIEPSDDATFHKAVEALYLHLKQDCHLIYCHEPAFDDVSGEQDIRLPAVTLYESQGTCIDLTLLFLSCLANVKLCPIFVQLHGHALAAVWVRPPEPRRKTFLDLAELRSHLEGDAVLAVECTGFAEGFPGRPYKVSFDEARQAGREMLRQLDAFAFRFALDVRRAWENDKVRPVTAWHRPKPSYRDEFTQKLAEQAERLRARRRELRLDGSSEELKAVEGELRKLRQELRDGPQLKPGDCLSDRYQLLKVVDSGGFGTVWRADDEETKQEVAVKVLHGQHCDSAERRERFERGARAMQRLTHPNIVRVLAPHREDKGYHYFVMEYIRGGTFAQAVTGGSLSAEQRIQVILQVGDALAFAHENGVVHRDVSPDNILLGGPGGAVRLTDFDLVLLDDSTGGTRTAAHLGKPVYAAPECQESAGAADARCDVYSLAMTAVFALYGKKLPALTLMWNREKFFQDLDCPPEVKVVLIRAARSDRDERFASMKAFCDALRQALTKPPVEALPPTPPVEARPAVAVVENSIGMKFAWIPPGSFLMGSPESEEKHESDEKQHRVTLTKGFFLGVHLVTQAQWQAVMGNNPSHFKGDNLPVERVTWDDCQVFCKKLTQQTGKPHRLPTEAEWEYACRAGTATPFHFGSTISTEQANYSGNYVYGGGQKGQYRQQTTPVGNFPANAWGLFDMHGNVWEWCQDWYGDYPSEDVTDPTGSNSGSVRVLRGGSWISNPWRLRAASRYWRAPGDRTHDVGVRVVFCLD
jgi:formylglycine-generating enzyme required for sulfatase activity